MQSSSGQVKKKCIYALNLYLHRQILGIKKCQLLYSYQLLISMDKSILSQIIDGQKKKNCELWIWMAKSKLRKLCGIQESKNFVLQTGPYINIHLCSGCNYNSSKISEWSVRVLMSAFLQMVFCPTLQISKVFHITP